VRFPQRSFDALWRLSSREDESEVARSFGQRLDRVVEFRRDLDPLDAVDRRCRIYSTYLTQETGLRNGNHHHADGVAAALERADRKAGSLTQNKFFEARPGAKFKDRRSQAAD
jgi:hypothetical protein